MTTKVVLGRMATDEKKPALGGLSCQAGGWLLLPAAAPSIVLVALCVSSFVSGALGFTRRRRSERLPVSACRRLVSVVSIGVVILGRSPLPQFVSSFKRPIGLRRRQTGQQDCPNCNDAPHTFSPFHTHTTRPSTSNLWRSTLSITIVSYNGLSDFIRMARSVGLRWTRLMYSSSSSDSTNNPSS